MDGSTPLSQNQHEGTGRPACFYLRPIKLTCPECKGTGNDAAEVPLVCSTCDGSGVITGPDSERIVGGAHSDEWVWERGRMTNRVRCIRCGSETVKLKS